MVTSLFWRLTHWVFRLCERLPETALRRYVAANDDDLQWFREALLDGKRKWLVAELAGRTRRVSEALFVPMLDAAIDEIDPSLNHEFIWPCVVTFGPRRVNEYLLDVAETGTNYRKAGAFNAMYHARAENSEDVWARQRILRLRTFVSNPDLTVRRSVISQLDLDPESYPEAERPLIEEAIRIAGESEDRYIRQRVEVQLGNVDTSAPLPHRKKTDA